MNRMHKYLLGLSFGCQRRYKVNSCIFVLPVNRWILCIFLQHRINISRKNPCHRSFKKFAQASDQITSCSAPGVNICKRTKDSQDMRKQTAFHINKHNNQTVTASQGASLGGANTQGLAAAEEHCHSLRASSSSCFAFPQLVWGRQGAGRGQLIRAANPNRPAGHSMLYAMLSNKNWGEGVWEKLPLPRDRLDKSLPVGSGESVTFLPFPYCFFHFIHESSHFHPSHQTAAGWSTSPPHVTVHFCKKLHKYLKCSQSWIRIMFAWKKFKNASSNFQISFNFVLHCKHTVIPSIY